jgi:hypothetical protein
MRTNIPLVSIYALVDPDSLLVHYIGCTTQILKKRKSNHLSSSRNGNTSMPVYKWISELLKKDKEPEIVLLERTPWTYKEAIWVKFFSRIAHPIKNKQLTLTYKYGPPYDNQRNCDDLLKEFFICNRKLKTKRLASKIRRAE